MNNVQIELLKLLETYKDVCQKKNLRYFVSGGTMLGAVRHRGFIPWDDDVDIVMPRIDYEELAKVKDFPGCISMSIEDELLYGIFRNNNIRVTHGSKVWDEKEPFLSLDICPADGAGNCYIISLIHTTYCLVLFTLIKLKRIRYIQKTEGLKNRKRRPLGEKILIEHGAFLAHMLRKIDEKKLVEKYYAACKKYDYDKSKYICVYPGRGRYKEIMRRTIHGAGRDLCFEGMTVKGYSEPEAYLRKMYGKDYMVLPPVEAREKHGNLRIV